MTTDKDKIGERLGSSEDGLLSCLKYAPPRLLVLKHFDHLTNYIAEKAGVKAKIPAVAHTIIEANSWS